MVRNVRRAVELGDGLVLASEESKLAVPLTTGGRVELGAGCSFTAMTRGASLVAGVASDFNSNRSSSTAIRKNFKAWASFSLCFAIRSESGLTMKREQIQIAANTEHTNQAHPLGWTMETSQLPVFSGKERISAEPSLPSVSTRSLQAHMRR